MASLKLSPVNLSEMLALCVLALLAGPAFGRSAIKIIGGEDAEIGQLPYQGSLRYTRDSGERFHYCGCALVSAKFCVSAAHCTWDAVSRYDVQLGVTIRSQPDDGQIIEIAQIFNHPSYGTGPGFSPNDISVIELAEEADLTNSYIATIQMAEQGDEFDSQTGIISGWGYTNTGAPTELPDHLQFVEVNVFSRQECEDLRGSSFSNGMVCVGVLGSAGACNGDSGGPLAVGDILVGITSWGTGGCSPTLPSVYTSIEYFRDWLDGTITA